MSAIQMFEALQMSKQPHYSPFNWAYFWSPKHVTPLDLFLSLPPPPLVSSLSFFLLLDLPCQIHKSECFHCCWNHNLWDFYLTGAFPFSIIESTAAGYPWQEKKKKRKTRQANHSPLSDPLPNWLQVKRRIIGKGPEHILENRKIIHSSL